MDNERDIFEQARAIRLQGEEEAASRAKILRFMEEHPVTVPPDACLTERMDDLTQRFFEAAKHLRLAPKEDIRMEQQLQAFMKKHPLPSSREEGFLRVSAWNLLHSFSFVRGLSGVLAVAILCAAGGGLTYAAEASLPGDLLYPIKIHVNEEVWAGLTLDETARADWEANRLERRVREAETLAVQERLDARNREIVRKNIEKQMERTAKHVADLKAKNAEVAADIGSRIEAKLEAHRRALVLIAAENLENRTNLQSVLQEIRNAATLTMESRADAEAAVTMQAGVEVIAEKNIRSADDHVGLVQRLIKEKHENLTEDASVRAEAQLERAKEAIVKARERAQEQAHGEAFRLAKKAQRDLEETATLFQTERSLNLSSRAALGIAAKKQHQSGSTTSVEAILEQDVKVKKEKKEKDDKKKEEDPKEVEDKRDEAPGASVEGNAGVPADVSVPSVPPDLDL